LADQIKICHGQVLLKNSEDSHAKKQCFYMPPFTLFASDGIWAESKTKLSAFLGGC
jgi:hypothetical protein